VFPLTLELREQVRKRILLKKDKPPLEATEGRASETELCSAGQVNNQPAR
jgi:hypothetical protein